MDDFVIDEVAMAQSRERVYFCNVTKFRPKAKCCKTPKTGRLVSFKSEVTYRAHMDTCHGLKLKKKESRPIEVMDDEPEPESAPRRSKRVAGAKDSAAKEAPAKKVRAETPELVESSDEEESECPSSDAFVSLVQKWSDGGAPPRQPARRHQPPQHQPPQFFDSEGNPEEGKWRPRRPDDPPDVLGTWYPFGGSSQTVYSEASDLTVVTVGSLGMSRMKIQTGLNVVPPADPTFAEWMAPQGAQARTSVNKY